jgi:hypothetical protein
MRTTTAHRERQLLPWVWAAGLALLLWAPAAMAGDTQCSSSKAASELVSCGHCQVFKELMHGAEGSDIDLEMFELQHGVVVQLEGSSEAAVAMIQDLVDAIWAIDTEQNALQQTSSMEPSPESEYCPDCTKRIQKLKHAGRDRALTDTGAVVVLTSDDRKLVDWLRKDTQQFQGWLQTADSSH